MRTAHALYTLHGVLAAATLVLIFFAGCQSASSQETQGTSMAAPTTNRTNGTWVLVGEDWVYVSGTGPEVCLDTVCAGADGSTIIMYKRSDLVDPQIRCILIESEKPKGVKNKSGKSADFLKDKASFVDVHLWYDKIDPAEELNWTQSDLTNSKPPAGVPSQGIWDILRAADSKLWEQHQVHLPDPKVGKPNP